MKLEDLKHVCPHATQMNKYPNLWVGRVGDRVFVLDTDVEVSIDVDISDENFLDGRAEVDTFIAEHGLTDKERAALAERRRASAAVLTLVSTVEDGTPEHDVEEDTTRADDFEIVDEDVDMDYPIEGEEFTS